MPSRANREGVTAARAQAAFNAHLGQEDSLRAEQEFQSPRVKIFKR